MKLALLTLLPIAVFAGGCTVPVHLTKDCRADSIQAWVGQPYSAKRARFLQGKALARQRRDLGPGMGATMEYRADRLNVIYDARGRISRLYCG